MAEIAPIDPLYRTRIATLAQQLLSDQDEQRCVFFLGSGMGVSPGRHLPTGSELSSMLAADVNLDFPKPSPLPSIAFYYEFYRTRAALNNFLVDKLTADAIPVSPATARLVDLILKLEELKKQPILIITTNYDQHLERLYRQRTGRDLTVVIYNGGRDANDESLALHTGYRINNLQLWQPKATCLYKMHGCISDPGDERLRNLVITEDDYINFLSNCLSHDMKKRVLTYVLGRLSESPIVFLGYSLSDWNLRVIFKTTAEKRHRDCYAIQRPDPEDEIWWKALVQFWGVRNFTIVNQFADAFLDDLCKAVDEQIAPAVAAGSRT